MFFSSCLVIICCFLNCLCGGSVLNLKMEEESAKFTTIGSILSVLPKRIPPPMNVILNDPKTDYFTINDKGDVQVSAVIDLETLCDKDRLCCGPQKCHIPIRGYISHGSALKHFEVQVEVTDKNDHKPFFKSSVLDINPSESAKVGSTIRLKSAIDKDKTKKNTVQRYSLTEKTQTFIFDDTDGPALRIMKPLDYEKMSQYPAVLEACDPDWCSRQTLNINIVDENDNKPQFERKLYKISIPESHPLKTPVLKLKAIDEDSGQYGSVLYSFGRDEDEPDKDVKKTFRIDKDTGEVLLQRQLSVESRSDYSFKVYAMDSDPQQKDTADVIITVEDVNNHKPIISILVKSNNLTIQENSQPGQIAILRAHDKDQGNNGKVTCRLTDSGTKSSFSLSLDEGLYHLNSTRTFDYETEISITATIQCNDLGEPRLTGELPIPINIIDVNEFDPRFAMKLYNAHIRENADPGSKVVRLQATDKDGSANLTFHLDKHGTQYFTVDRTTGFIYTTTTKLDREDMTQIVFQAFVEDSNINPRRANVTVKVLIDDQNDNVPVFGSKRYFEIKENQPAYHQLNGALMATDADSELNGQVGFRLIRVWGLDDPVGTENSRRINELTKYHYFKVQEMGQIKAVNSLDRESYSEYILEVIAFDKGIPSLSSTANITIKVLDENDNSPQWTFPKDRDAFVNITSSHGIGEEVVRVRARDRDSGKNGKIQFILVSEGRVGSSSSSTSQFFALNATNGKLTVTSPLSPGQYELRLRATDLGVPEQHSESYLIVNVLGADVAQLNFTIIIVMISATAIISVFLVIAIICVRRRPPQYSPPSGSDLTKDHLPPWAYPIDEQSLQPMSDNVSNIYMPDACQQEGVALHTFNQHPGRYCPPNEALPRLPYELDGDSADSGRGGSEDDPGLHHHLLNGDSKGRPFSPIQFHNRPPPGQVRGSATLLRNRVSSPAPNAMSSNNCGCYILPEDGIIQSGQSPYPANYTMRPAGLATPTNRAPLLPGQSPNYGQMHPPPPAYDTLSLTRGATAKRPMPHGSAALLDPCTSSGGYYLPRMNLSSESSHFMTSQPYGTVARTPVTRRASQDCPPVSGLPPIPPLTNATILPPMSIRPAATQPATLNGAATSSSIGSLRGSPEPLPAPPKNAGSGAVVTSGSSTLVNGDVTNNNSTDSPANSSSTFSNNFSLTSTFSKGGNSSVNKPLLGHPKSSDSPQLHS